jgi:hypothetical protein
MPIGVFRLQLGVGEFRLARGDASEGPRQLLPPDVTLDTLLGAAGPKLADTLAIPSAGEIPPDGSRQSF